MVGLPTMAKAAISNPGRDLSKVTNKLAAKRMMIRPIIPPTKMTRNFPPSIPPICGRFVFGSVMAKATAARVESNAKAMSANSTLRTVPQNPDFFFSFASRVNLWYRKKRNL